MKMSRFSIHFPSFALDCCMQVFKMFVNLRNSRYMQYLSAITATLSMAASSTYLFWSSPSLPKLQSEDSPIGRPLSDEEGSWIVSCYVLATVPAAFVSAWLIERIGRKKTLLFGGVLLFLPWFMIIFANHVVWLYFGRIISGVGGGMITITCSIYNGEIAENDIRGKLGTTFVMLKLVGSLIVLSVGPYVSYKLLGIISAIISLVFIASFVFMPESPYYLMRVNDRVNAEKNLRILSSNTAEDKFIEDRLNEIQYTVDEDMRNKTTFWEFLSNRQYRNSIIIMIGIKTLQQLSGLNAIDAYLQTIVELTSSNISPEASSIIFGFVQIPAVLLATFLVDKVGRRPLLIISAFGCGVALFAEGTYFYLQDFVEADVSYIAWLPTTGIALYLIMNPLGITTLAYVLLGELFPTNIKGIAVSAATLYGGVLAFLVSKFFKPLSNAWGIYTIFWIFASICVMGTLFVYIFLPETKGKTFVEIQDVLKNKKIKSVEIKS